LINYSAITAILGAFTFIFMGCGRDRNIPDVSNIKVDVKLQRFDQDIFTIDTTHIQEAMVTLAKKYPEMLPLFTANIIHDQTNPTETPEQALGGFVRAPEVRRLYDTVQHLYGDLRWLERDLSQMFRYYKYYFPERQVPKVVTMVSEYATDAFTASDTLCGIGLDMFLGENFAGYNPENFPDFIRRNFRKEYMTVRLAKALAQNIAELPAEQRLLDLMLYNGKILYITDCLLPETPDSLKMGYTAAQMAGCNANEQEAWARLLDQKLLYSTDFQKIRKLINPSPNAPVLFQEAPGEVGNWLGWQIVKAWVKRNPNASMRDLLNFRDAQKFLEAAKYKPKR
jgi:hypothetical protein